jgi:hypothetical protein
MTRLNIVGACHTSSLDFDSSQESVDGSTVLPFENNTTSIQTTLPSSITITPRRSMKAKRNGRDLDHKNLKYLNEYRENRRNLWIIFNNRC